MSSRDTKKLMVRRGFTLTEIAIVLAIFGLLLAAIWVGSTMAYTAYKTNKLSADITSMIYQLSSAGALGSASLYPESAALCQDLTYTSGGVTYTTAFSDAQTWNSASIFSSIIYSNSVPQELYDKTPIPTALQDLFGGKMDLILDTQGDCDPAQSQAASGSTPAGPQYNQSVGPFANSFILAMPKVTSKSCIYMLTQNQEVWRRLGLDGVNGTMLLNSTNFPLSMGSIVTMCNANSAETFLYFNSSLSPVTSFP